MIRVAGLSLAIEPPELGSHVMNWMSCKRMHIVLTGQLPYYG